MMMRTEYSSTSSEGYKLSVWFTEDGECAVFSISGGGCGSADIDVSREDFEALCNLRYTLPPQEPPPAE
jgi:hypothetical protein